MNLNTQKIIVRPATIEDSEVIVSLMKDMGEFENNTEKDAQIATPELIRTNVFIKKYSEILIVEVDGVPAGFCCFYHNFSTWLGKPGLWLEDIFVLPEYRRLKLGVIMFEKLAKICQERECIRLEWICADWNTVALKFYKKLGLKIMSDWIVHRLDADDIKRLAMMKNTKL